MAEDKYKIEDFEVGEERGRGGFAKVFSAKLKPDVLNPCNLPEEVAIKKICKKLVETRNLQGRVQSEIEIHKKLNHPNIVKFYTVFEDESFYYLVLELCKKTLNEYIKEAKPSYTECIAFDIIEQIVDGLDYLHKHNIMHRDLSIRNILQADDNQWKITDFGLSIDLQDKDTKHKMFSVVGTPDYLSPEMLANKPYDKNSEFWNFGCVIFAVLGGKLPLDVKNAERRENQISKIRCSEEAKTLLKNLLKNDPSRRWSLDEIKKSEFYDKYSNFHRHDHVKETNKYTRKNGSSNDSGRGSHATTSASSRKDSPQSDRILDSGCGSSNSKSAKNRKNLRNYQQSNELSYQSNHSSNRHRHDFKKPLKPLLEVHENRIAPKSNPCTTEQFAYHNNLKKRYQTLPSRPSPIIPSMPYETSSYPKYTNVGYEDRPTHDTIDPFYPLQPATNSRERSASEEQRKQDRRRLERQLREIDSSEAGHVSHHSRDRSRSKMSQNKSGERSSQHSSRDRDRYFSPSRTNIQTENNPQYSNNEDNSVSKKNIRSRKVQSEISTLKPLSKPEPFNTERLLPTRYPMKKTAVVSILNSGEVCVEWLKTEQNKQYISDVAFISNNGKLIETFKPQDCLVGSAPPPKPNDNKQIKIFRYDNLPQTYWKIYRKAKRLVDFVRSTTPKITLYQDDCKIVMMENYPDPDFEMEFFADGCPTGRSVTQKSNKVTLTDEWGKSISISEVESSESHFAVMRDKFDEMKEWCKDTEAGLEASKSNGKLRPFPYPVTYGHPPQRKKGGSAKDNFKENIAFHSSEQPVTSKSKYSSNSYERQKRNLKNSSNR